MSTLGDLVTRYADLGPADVDWLHALLAEWQLLADLSFADLVLWVHTRESNAFVAVGQLRPTTGPTAYLHDVVGMLASGDERFLLDRAWRDGRICREGDPDWSTGIPVREEAIPVRRGGRIIAVISRHTNLAAARTPSQLELTYLRSAGDLAQMTADGRFPFADGGGRTGGGPRVGDGLIRLDADGVVEYASPNALSAYRRLGWTGDVTELRLADVTQQLVGHESVLANFGVPSSDEVEAHGAVVELRLIPLATAEHHIGALVLVHDVTELRLRDRALLGKETTIREIHHRVKNNLQTVAALLRLQARRLDAPDAREALEESVRRVSSIALVHETLSRTEEESVEFDEIADRLLAMVADDLVGSGTARPARQGSFGVLPSAIATPLALVLTELMQNAVEHGLAGRAGQIEISADRTDQELHVVVADDGAGLPGGFDLENSTQLGLQIVRTLVVGELGGRIVLRNRARSGTEAIVDVPLPAG